MIDTDFMDALPRPIGRTADRELLDWGNSCDGSVLLLLLQCCCDMVGAEIRGYLMAIAAEAIDGNV